MEAENRVSVLFRSMPAVRGVRVAKPRCVPTLSSSIAIRRSPSSTHGNSCGEMAVSSGQFIAPQTIRTHVDTALDQEALEPLDPGIYEGLQVRLGK